MTTIRNLSQEWWNNLFFEEKFYPVISWLKSQGKNVTERHPDSLTGREIENIFSQEVIVKWWDNLPTWGDPSREYYMGLYFVDDTITLEKIKEIYLKEHTKEEQVENEFNKWLEDKKQRYSINKEMCYQDILSSTTSAINQFLKSPYEAQRGVLESAVKCNEMFLNFCDEQPKEDVWDEDLIIKFFYYLKYDKGIETLEDSFMNDFKQYYTLIRK